MAKSVAILGSGNMAFQLLSAFDKAGIPMAGLTSRDLAKGADTIEKTKAKCELVGGRILTDLQADIIILAVPDDSIREVLRFYQFSPDHVIVHTAGAEPMATLDRPLSGVFYPLQTFTWGEPVDFSQVPILVEGSNETIVNDLREIGQAISQRVQEMSSEDRLRVHVAAVMVSNFTNHLYHRAARWMKSSGLSFDLLHPLIEETWRKAKTLGPAEAQTGPARRGDQATMQRHLDLISDEALRQLYSLISQDIARLSS